MSGIAILGIAIAVFLIAYVTYGSWLAKQWGVDPSRKTPAHTEEDGVDFVPAKAPVLLGHHFSSIAGAGPINGPIQAAIFGWVPVLLWIVIGGIFFGAVQDFSSLFASIRHKGKSLGEVIEENISTKAKVCFTVFAWLVLILVVAAFADIVAGTFAGVAADSADAAAVSAANANGSVATASMLFIPLAVMFGFMNRKNLNLLISTVIGVVLLAVCIVAGLNFPLHVSKNVWLFIVFAYIFVASVAPVWILLQPRDYLNSFLLYFMIIAAIIGIFGTNPNVQLSAFTGWNINGQTLFPFLFITVACGAVSGFHSLISSGTTSKQINSEKDAKLIGYGSMLIECVLAVIALVAVGYLTADGAYTSIGTPPKVFATAISTFFANMGMGDKAVSTVHTIILLAISAFALTSLDTATRLGRFLFQELFATKKDGSKNILGNMYVATIITIAAAGLLTIAGYSKIWALFGACNQLVAVPAFLAVACWLKKIGRNHKMFYFPMFFMLAATLSSLVITFVNNVKKLVDGTGTFLVEGLQDILVVPIVVLAIIMVIDGFKVLFGKTKQQA
ncbi:carbon starvation protein A [Lacrimispora sp. NSJ-141]|uniref:Carbon starvation protein A n=1 Tax=Lientehia hominis TaxID=2897778 RepID=A0AAP2W8V9_9FIRM|nr:carbon starvation protein A [Lientehia hominis]MCD2492655.1 carbon starvation protein A [Lientehia hominis]